MKAKIKVNGKAVDSLCDVEHYPTLDPRKAVQYIDDNGLFDICIGDVVTIKYKVREE